MIPSGLIETIERTMFIAERTRGAGIADVRDIGASVRGTVAAGSVDYQLGLFNKMGESQNAVDQNDQKAVLGRLAIRIPGTASLQIGGSGGFEGGPPAQHRERAGAEVQLKRSRITLRSEVMTARDGLARKLGYYALGVVRPTPVVDIVARFDDWDPDLHLESGAADAHERQIVAGANYYVDGSSTRVAANLVHASFPSHRVAASTLLLLSLQVLW